MDETIDELIALLTTGCSPWAKSVNYGYNPVPSQGGTPFIEVIPMATRQENKGTGGMKDNTINIQIIITSSLTNYVKSNAKITSGAFAKDFIQKIEARTNSVPNADSIFGILNANLQLSDSVQIIGDFETQYDNFNRDGFRFIRSTINIVGRFIS